MMLYDPTTRQAFRATLKLHPSAALGQLVPVDENGELIAKSAFEQFAILRLSDFEAVSLRIASYSLAALRPEALYDPS